ncbi:hypothetical protein Q2410_27300, partial [Escherichia coli]|nr:hypothetical protein [Escherichia coli]
VLNCEDEGLSPITNKHQRLATAMILENQENYCLENSNSSGAGGVFGTAGTSLYDPSYAVGATSGNDRYA